MSCGVSPPSPMHTAQEKARQSEKGMVVEKVPFLRHFLEIVKARMVALTLSVLHWRSRTEIYND